MVGSADMDFRRGLGLLLVGLGFLLLAIFFGIGALHFGLSNGGGFFVTGFFIAIAGLVMMFIGAAMVGSRKTGASGS